MSEARNILRPHCVGSSGFAESDVKVDAFGFGDSNCVPRLAESDVKVDGSSIFGFDIRSSRTLLEGRSGSGDGGHVIGDGDGGEHGESDVDGEDGVGLGGKVIFPASWARFMMFLVFV